MSLIVFRLMVFCVRPRFSQSNMISLKNVHFDTLQGDCFIEQTHQL